MPADEATQKAMARSLFVVHSPDFSGVINEQWLKLQDEYLKKQCEAKDLVDVDTLSPISKTLGIKPKPTYLQGKAKPNDAFTMYHSDRICLIKNDLTNIKCDAVVNTTNEHLIGSMTPAEKSVEEAIYLNAGVQLRIALNEIYKKQGKPELVGFAKITDAFNLPCKKVIHTVGPRVDEKVVTKLRDAESNVESSSSVGVFDKIFEDMFGSALSVTAGDQAERELNSCYGACLALAEENGLNTVAFPLISTGYNNFPKAEAALVAIQAVDEYLDESEGIEKVVFVAFEDVDYEVMKSAFEAVGK